tara:strand:- start:2843 stop:3679 length:837 start_codon:yes stop_codon:yes gene_type:complete
MTNRVAQLSSVQQEALELFERKNRDYGDAFATYGPVGVLVRIGDKMSRFNSISNSGVMLVDNEGLRDTLIDLHNYAAMAVMLLDEAESKQKKLAVNEVVVLKNSGMTLTEIVSKGYSDMACKLAGFSAHHFRNARKSATVLKELGFTLEELIQAGFTLPELVLAEFTPSQFRALNYANSQLSNIGYNLEELYDVSSSMLEEDFVKCIYKRRFAELRRGYDDDMTLREGGNRLGYVEDQKKAEKYAEEARQIYQKYQQDSHMDRSQHFSFDTQDNKMFY